MENPISITMLNDFVFCPVSIYFHNFYQGVEKNLYQGKSQINGTKAHETIDKNTLNLLVANYQNNYLKMLPIKMYDKKKLEWIDSQILVTNDEAISIQNISAQLMCDTIYRYCWDDPYIFKNKIYKALKVLGYTKIYNSITCAMSGMYKDEDINIKPDELGIFIHYYGKTLK